MSAELTVLFSGWRINTRHEVLTDGCRRGAERRACLRALCQLTSLGPSSSLGGWVWGWGWPTQGSMGVSCDPKLLCGLMKPFVPT